MKVEALVTFPDYKRDKIRKVGDVFEVSRERYEELNKKGQKYTGQDWVAPVIK